MTTYEDKLKKKIDLVRKHLKYYQQITAEEYINDRVLYKIKLYFLFGKSNKTWYNVIAVVAIISGLLVPLFLALDVKYAKEYATFFTLLAGALISLELQYLILKRNSKAIKKLKTS